MLLGIEGHAGVLLDGPWGSGKTAFVKMSAAHLRAQEVRVVDFNAWRQGHTGVPLVDLVSAISSELGNNTKKELIKAAGKIMAHVAVQTVRAGTSGLVDLEKVGSDENRDLTASWEESERETGRFKAQLAKVAAEQEEPLVVVIDELDRCQPTYALEVLATVRHLFDVDGVIVVLAINRGELIHSIHSIFGPEFSADRYLHRFADLHTQLLSPSEPDLTNFLSELLQSTGVWIQARGSVRKMLWLVSAAPGCGLRDIQQVAHHTAAIAASLSSERNLVIRESYLEVFVALIVLRTLDRSAYRNIAAGRIDGFEAIAAARKALTPEGSGRAAVNSKDLIMLEVVLLTVASAVQLRTGSWEGPTTDVEVFTSEYQKVVYDEISDPPEVFRLFHQWNGLSWLTDETVQWITDLIDMIDPR
ncbi:KAP family P-loop NTPase fold protein [Candidatus Poriferisocius sp.]|uniref:KAP family P-loop NTPase fold protein n=1 Tax=Candidatus Poriferisocius sp. TaxID=3101276 RepID=UPI003B01311E